MSITLFSYHLKYILSKNFCLLYFMERGEIGHFLLLNLVSRVKYWIERDEIEEEMKAEVPNFNLDGELWLETIVGLMKVETDKIEIPYQIGGTYSDQVLGEFESNFHLFKIWIEI